jgi:hypothetical protein
MSESKTHYRKVFKSDHLGVADLEDMIEEGKSLVVTIEHVKQENGVRVAGKKGNHNIAYFTDKKIKPLVINAGNSKIIKSFCENSPFVEDWVNVQIELYILNNVKFGKETVQGVRIKDKQPKPKEILSPLSKVWEKSKEKAKSGTSIDIFRLHYQITDENYKLLLV